MVSRSPMGSNPSDRPPSVRYIEDSLPQRHPMFDNAPIHYEPRSQQYVMNSQLVGQTGLMSVTTPPPRPEYTDLRAMKVWNHMYPAAMEEFRSANPMHKRRAEEYNIHKAADWDDVYAILEHARDKYRDNGGAVGWFRRIRRKAADNVDTVQVVSAIAAKMIPDNPYSTPVLGAVGMLLDAVKQTATVRQQVAQTFDGDGSENLIPIFSDVELFLGDMFDKDPNIHKASLDLTVAALKAIDLAVGFYTSKAVRQTSKAIFLGSDYERPLIDSLTDLSRKSKRLVDEAYKSHMHEAHLYSEHGRRMMGALQATVVHGFNGMNYLLGEHLRSRDEQIQQKDAELARINRELLHVMIENERLRSVSPGPGPWQPPTLSAPSFVRVQVQVQVPVQIPYISHEQLKAALGMATTDTDDMHLIFRHESQFLIRERAQAEQVVQQTHFVNWIVSADSCRLLVQWEDPVPRTYADLSPLSLFCAKMAQALDGQNRFMSIQWFYGCHLRDYSPGGSGLDMLKGLAAQLLRAYRDGFNMQILSQVLDMHAVFHSPSIEGFDYLVTWLVRSLPRATTLFCFVDGVVMCERPEHWNTAAPALLCLLRLVRDPAVQATVKVLFTSTPGPMFVRGDFEDEGTMIDVGTLPRLGMAPSDARMARQLAESMG